VLECDGHDPVAIDAAMTAAKTSDRPTMIACKTHIALGHAAQDTSKGHGALTDKAQLQAAKDAYGWKGGPFEIPAKIKAEWEAMGTRGAKAHADWSARVASLSAAKQAELIRIFSDEAPAKLPAAIRAVKKAAVAAPAKLATRSASEKVLAAVNPIMPETFAGSADLTGSNNTNTADLGVFNTDTPAGRYMYWGIREHGMAAAMNGMALHGGVRPYSGTFMAFTDYARPSMRLSALMGLPVVYVMTHDSIGLGEDGPTHQPVEHLAISRATPNTLVFRPADLVEVAECWELAFSQKSTPSVMALSRQNLAAVRLTHTNTNLSAKGAYVLAEATGKRQVILMATGSEVEIALKAREMLEAQGIGTRVVSMPSMELFAAQDEAYRKKVLPAGPVRVAIEAGVRMGWDRWLLGERGRDTKADFVGMSSFGASAPYDRLYKEFGITAEATVEKVKALL
jgi:transketolase